ncbi:MAG: hypothetical protein NVV72_10330 [Asticcacaulis sp.]|nr:hypothetical protein [Asticcacaulis sp.]
MDIHTAVDTRDLTAPNSESTKSGIHWAAILGGGVAASAATLVLIPLGTALGFGSFSVWHLTPATGTTLGAGLAIWFVVTQWISAGLGGYLAGRSRVKWADTHSDEVFFRDTVHGFLSWAVATLFVAGLTAVIATGTVSAGGDAAAKIAAGAATGAAQNADASPANLDYYINGLYRGAAVAGSPTPTEESGEILVKAVADGSLPADDRAYLASQISARTGLTQPAAEARVDQAMSQLNAAKVKATQAAETARKAATYASWALVISLVVGAFIASVAGAIGGRQRDAV